MNKNTKKIDLSECEMVKINISIAISYNHPICTHREAPCNILEAANDFNNGGNTGQTPILQVIRDYMAELKFIEPFNRTLEIGNIKITSMVAK